MQIRLLNGGCKMEKFTLNRRNITTILSYLFLTAIFFIFGLFIGFHNGNDPILKETSTPVTAEQNSTPSQMPSQPTSNYRVILEDGELRLYIDENGISRLISREEISEDSYPVSDIASLKKGLIFETSDGAISLMENFIS